MESSNKSLKRSLIILAGLLIILVVLFLLFTFHTNQSPTKTLLEVNEDVIMRYEKEKPSFEEWTRVTSSSSPIRYKKVSDGQYKKLFPTTANTARIMFAGDLMCEPAMSRAVFTNDRFFFELCFDKIKKVFEAADFAIANLETQVDQDSPYAIDIHKLSDRYHCNAPIDYLRAVRYSGIDAVTMANNHTCDTGALGLFHTIQNVDSYGLLHTGAFTSPQNNRYLIVDINGIKVAFFSYTEHFNSRLDEKCFTSEGRDIMLNLYSKEKLDRDLAAAKAAGAEFTIVYIHFWCKDYTHEISESQRNCAREIAEAGIDCIVGSHPHAIQPYDEIITSTGKRVPVNYSLGNFITSDSNPITRTNIIYELFLEKDSLGTVHIADEKYIPCMVVESAEKSGFIVFPTPKNWRSGEEIAFLQEAEEDIKQFVGRKIEIDYHNN